ncbi:hypothetical protein [Nitrosomonas communis]|uniref:Uncharacterized protein n=1 Tax=Nitrosomonas communis TaxID=44574 RepID=A0A1H2S3U0_9PROT|nr:hypothetical protein [Nitrosomonas communis]SDW26185.1 hypothetical protein SAMN05421882_100620 [Nitrosomonas communis]
MGRIWELFESRVSHLRFQDEKVELHFSFTYIHLEHKPAVVWSQEVIMLMEHAQLEVPLPPLPNTAIEGYLELNGKQYESIPLPLPQPQTQPQKQNSRLYLQFADESVLALHGEHLEIRLVGEKLFLSDRSMRSKNKNI